MKPKKTKVLAAKVPDELARWYAEQAGDESVSLVVREALREYYAQRVRAGAQGGGGPPSKASTPVQLPRRQAGKFDSTATEL